MKAKKPSKKMAVVKCRRAKLADLDTVADMAKELYDFHKKYGWYENFKKNYREVLKRDIHKVMKLRDSAVFVAEIDGKIVGYALVLMSPQPREPLEIYVWQKEAEITDLFVKKGYRDKGAGDKLFKAALEFSKKRGADVLELVASVKNKRAEKFYLREGMDLYDEVFVERLKK